MQFKVTALSFLSNVNLAHDMPVHNLVPFVVNLSDKVKQAASRMCVGNSFPEVIVRFAVLNFQQLFNHLCTRSCVDNPVEDETALLIGCSQEFRKQLAKAEFEHCIVFDYLGTGQRERGGIFWAAIGI